MVNLVTNDDRVFCKPCLDDLAEEPGAREDLLAPQGTSTAPCEHCGARRDVTKPRFAVVEHNGVTVPGTWLGHIELTCHPDDPHPLPEGTRIHFP